MTQDEDNCDEDLLVGGVKINFKMSNPVVVANELSIGNSRENFVTKFEFSNKSVLVLAATNKVSWSTGDLVSLFCLQLNVNFKSQKIKKTLFKFSNKSVLVVAATNTVSWSRGDSVSQLCCQI